MGTGASTSVDLSMIESLEDQFLRYSEEEIFGALEATVSDAKSAKQLMIQIGELERLLGTISGIESRRDMRVRLQGELKALRARLKTPTFRKSEFARSLTLFAVEEASCEEEEEDASPPAHVVGDAAAATTDGAGGGGGGAGAPTGAGEERGIDCKMGERRDRPPQAPQAEEKSALREAKMTMAHESKIAADGADGGGDDDGTAAGSEDSKHAHEDNTPQGK